MKKYLNSLRILLVITIGVCTQANAHMDHDKARFVAANGSDKGDCKNRFRPCASISYAAQQANKGDAVLVAQGEYRLEAFADVFYLISDVVPAYGGFQILDNYQVQNPNAFPTTLIGVPAEYAKQLHDKGFNVIVDSKGNTTLSDTELNKSLAQVEVMYQSQAETPCVNGAAGAFPCNNMSLLSHVPVNEFPTSSQRANDIWGHVDLNTMKEYALVGLRRGVALVDVSDPVNPLVINAVEGQDTTWRDIKVYQYFNRDLNKWEAYAFATADSATEGLTIMNLSNPDDGLVLVTRNINDRSAHNIYISNVDYGLNIKNSLAEPQAHILGSNALGGSMRSYRISDPENPISTYFLSNADRSDYTHDASSFLINDERADRDCVNKTAAGCTVMLDFNEGTLRLWDHSALGGAVELSAVSYPNVEYTHSGWWSEDRQYVILHDELDEQRNGLNTTVHIFDISDLNAPNLVSTWVGPTRAVDHNGFVRGNKYYMSNYTRGVTVLDLSDPTSPTEIGYFDTFPSITNASFNGTWGVYPYLPSGIILASDIQGGLYVLKDETQSSSKDDLRFSANIYEVTEGEDLTISVTRSGTQAISVDYQLIRGATSSNDFEALESGTISWGAGDSTPQTITISALDDGNGEGTESMFIRLENPSPNAELLSPNIAKIDILSLTGRLSSVVIPDDDIEVRETDGSFTLTVTRSGAADQAASVSLSIQSDTAQAGTDASLSASSLEWSVGELGDKSVSVNIVNDSDNEETETFSIILENPENVTIEGSASVLVSILDDDSNLAPEVNSEANLNVNARAMVSLVGTASDPENQTMTFAWTQTSGESVTLNNADSLTATFTAPDGDATLGFEFTASDDFGLQASTSVSVSVEAVTPVQPPAVTPPPPTPPSSSGGALWLFNALVLIALSRRLASQK